MKSKVFSLVGLSIFIVAMFAVFTSAITSNEFTITNVNAPTSIDENAGSFTFTFNLIYTGTSQNMSISFMDSTSSVGSISIPTATGMNGTINESRTITGTINNFANQAGNIANIIINATTTNNSRDDKTTFSVSFIGESFCSNRAVNDTDLRLKVDINNIGQGDDNDWMPLDTIEIKVRLENNNNLDGNGDLNDVFFELGLFKEGSSNNIINDMIWISKDEEKVKVGDINEDKNKKYTFKFRVDPREVKDSNYVLRVKAFPKGDERKTCIDHSADLTDFGSSDSFAKIRVSKENDKEKMVVVDESGYSLVTNAFCGEQISLPVDVYNIGDEDFDNQVKVTLVNKELGIDKKEIASGDLNEGEKANVKFLFNVPTDAQEKTYTLSMKTFYNYNKDDKTYDEVSDDTFNALLKVEGNCVYVSDASVNASLESGGKAGEELVVKSMVTNTGDKKADYLVNAAGYNSWASSVKVNPTAFTLKKGESKEVLITLNVKKDVSGEKRFDLEVLSGNELVKTQPVSISIEKTGFFTGGVIGAFGFGEGKAYLWLLGLLNAILVIIIIFVAVRVLKKQNE